MENKKKRALLALKSKFWFKVTQEDKNARAKSLMIVKSQHHGSLRLIDKCESKKKGLGIGSKCTRNAQKTVVDPFID